MYRMNSSNSSSGGVILDPPKKQDAPKKRWCLTLNNYSDEEYSSLINFFSSNRLNKWIIGKERGEKNDTPHLQMYVDFKDKIRFTALKKINERLHIEGTRGSEGDNVKYCSKEGNFKYANLKVPKPLRKLACEDNFFPWQEDIIKIVQEQPDERTIYWFYSEDGGRGKTTFCKYLVRYHDAIVLGGKASDMKHSISEYNKINGYCPELIISNISKSFDPKYLSYGGIEECKDMLFHSGKYEGGMVDGNCPHLIVFANFYPETDKMMKDRWYIRKIKDDNTFIKMKLTDR